MPSVVRKMGSPYHTVRIVTNPKKPSMMTNPPRKPASLIMLERHGIHAVAFRRHVEGVPIVETRSWPDCLSELDARPGSVLCIATNKQQWLRSIERIRALQSRQPKPYIIVMMDRNEIRSSGTRIVDVFHEVGCSFVVQSPFQVPDAAKLATRHVAIQPSPPISIVEEIWQRMPWQPAT